MTYHIRPIEKSDSDRLQAGLDALSATSIYARFFAPKSHFSKAELRYLTDVDGVDHIAFVAIEDESDKLVGVARAIRDPQMPTQAEMGIVIADEYQQQGLGKVMAKQLMDVLPTVGITHITALMLAENTPAFKLLTWMSEGDATRITRGYDGSLIAITLAIAPAYQSAHGE